MNYYEHHLGDYAAATAHLSWDEDMAYTRLIRAYYHHEKPIPADMKAAYRIVRANSGAQRKAVDAVLHEFFELQEDGWHQKRCDEEVARYRESGADRKHRQENERERQRQHRERRKQLFEQLKAYGVVPRYDTPTSELEAHLSRVTCSDSHAPVTPQSPSPVTPRHGPETASHSQEPGASNQTQSPGTNTDSEAERRAFERIKAAYPKFAGRQDWINAQVACTNLVARHSATWDLLLAAADRYAKHIRAKESEGTQFVLSPGKFFTAEDEPWKQPWDPPRTKADQRLGNNVSAAAEFMRRTEKSQ